MHAHDTCSMKGTGTTCVLASASTSAAQPCGWYSACAHAWQVPKEYIPGVVKGLEEMMSSGALAGFPVVDVSATLYDGGYHDVDSSVLAFQIAARAAFRFGCAVHLAMYITCGQLQCRPSATTT